MATTHLSALACGPTTGTSAAGAITLNAQSGTITTESVSTAAAAIYTLTVTNNKVAANDIVMVSVANGTNSAGDPTVLRITPAAGSVVITIKNTHATNAFNGTLKIAFMVFKGS